MNARKYDASPLSVLVRSGSGLPMEEAIKRADEAGLTLASNRTIGRIYPRSEEWKRIRKAFPCWSGTLSAYGEPDKKLESTIEYVNEKTGFRYVFPVPEEHVGRINVALVAEHPDFSIVTDGKNRVVDAKKVGIVEEFPVSPGHYCPERKYGIPCGRTAYYSDTAARYLSRIAKRVGLVSREGLREIGLAFMPSIRLGAVAESLQKSQSDFLDQISKASDAELIELLSGLSPERANALVRISGLVKSTESHICDSESLDYLSLSTIGGLLEVSESLALAGIGERVGEPPVLELEYFVGMW